ncbi:glycoside hydrolase family 18 [Apiospora arundinis]|uniref:Glycoside hydrolase family 18 n=1 Tax=Apiospora arundinis TaxID=335852 RepID=A0ABR2JFF3_9PEZI
MLRSLPSDALSKFKDLMKQHNDDKFKLCSKAVAGSANKQFHDFMTVYGNDYFTCEVIEMSMYCSYCHNCKYYFDGGWYTSKRRRDLVALEEEALLNSTATYGELWARGDSDPAMRKHLKTWVRGHGPTNPYEQRVYWMLDDSKADAVSLPVLMVVQGVRREHGAGGADGGQDGGGAGKTLILTLVGAILFQVPIADKVLGSVAELADVESIIAVVGAAGNAVFDIYIIIDDLDNTPLAIVNLVLDPLALGDVASVTKAAEIRRGMKPEVVAKLGSRVGQRLDKPKGMTGSCSI